MRGPHREVPVGPLLLFTTLTVGHQTRRGFSWPWTMQGEGLHLALPSSSAQTAPILCGRVFLGVIDRNGANIV